MGVIRKYREANPLQIAELTFYMSMDQITYRREAFTYFDLLADVGGLHAVLGQIAQFLLYLLSFISPFNNMLRQLVSEIYFTSQQRGKHSHNFLAFRLVHDLFEVFLIGSSGFRVPHEKVPHLEIEPLLYFDIFRFRQKKVVK